jgi:hypothetical protein
LRKIFLCRKNFAFALDRQADFCCKQLRPSLSVTRLHKSSNYELAFFQVCASDTHGILRAWWELWLSKIGRWFRKRPSRCLTRLQFEPLENRLLPSLSIHLPGPFTYQEGEYVFIQPEVSHTPEPDQCGSGPLMFSATGLPDGLSLDAATGQITGILPHSLANRIRPTREYSITLTVSDGVETASTSATLTIRNTDFTLLSPGDQSNSEGDYV